MNIISLKNARAIPGADNIVAEIVTITPAMAGSWLRANSLNRPVRRRHVDFLAAEIIDGHWKLNGQSIVISEDEKVLDGQHRLLAIIEAGIPVKTMVVYGISPEAFKTIDTGAVRSGGDALSLEYPELAHNSVKAIASAVRWCLRLETGFMGGRNTRVSNTDVIAYVKDHGSMVTYCDIISNYSRDVRPLPVACGIGLLEILSRKNEELAEQFCRGVFTGEELLRTDPEYVLRQMLGRNVENKNKYPMDIRMRMAIKAWNWRRRNKRDCKVQAISVTGKEAGKVVIL